MFGLKVTPRKTIFLFLILFDKIFTIFSVKIFLRFSLDLITVLIIDRLVLNKSPVIVIALVSFGKQEPP